MSWAETIFELQKLNGGYQVFEESGIFTVPTGVYKIWVTACAGGGSGGAYDSVIGSYAATGGGGGDFVVRYPIIVEPSQKISITLGKGGASIAGDGNGKPGGTTIIGDYITLVGGFGGSYGATSSNPAGGKAGGSFATAGGSYGQNMNAEDSPYVLKPLYMYEHIFEMLGGTGGSVDTGGGASLGKGGSSASTDSEASKRDGIYGSGGAGHKRTSGTTKSGKGGDGICVIEWGVIA